MAQAESQIDVFLFNEFDFFFSLSLAGARPRKLLKLLLL